MDRAINIVYLYKPKDILKGIIQHKYIKNHNFASFISSSIVYGNIQNIFTYDSSYFETKNETFASITMTLSQQTIKLTHLTMLSCYTDNCFNSIDVFGSNKEEDWKKICEIRTNTNYFKNNAALIECNSEIFYKSIKLVQTGMTNSNNNYFLFRYLEMFGYLSSQKLSFCSHYFCKKNNITFMFLLVIASQ